MLENQLLVVQKLFQWEGRDLNQIHEDYQSTMTVSKHDRLQRFMSTERSGRPLNNGSWQIARNDEDLGQSALIEAHGDHAEGETGTWEAWIGKRR